jgi:hypothetical protein
MLWGGIFVLALFAARSGISWFTLHAAGFFVASSWAIYWIWFSFFLGWLCKAAITRWGRHPGLPVDTAVFPGPRRGRHVEAIVWILVGLVTHTGYMLLPY